MPAQLISRPRHVTMWRFIRADESQLMGLVDRALSPLPYEDVCMEAHYRIRTPRIQHPKDLLLYVIY